MIYNFLKSDDTFQDPIITKQILSELSAVQHEKLEEGQCLFNPVTGDVIVPIVTQNTIAKIIVNIF